MITHCYKGAAPSTPETYTPESPNPLEPCWGEILYSKGEYVLPVCEGHWEPVYHLEPKIGLVYNDAHTEVLGEHCKVCGNTWGRNCKPPWANHKAGCIFQTDRAHYVY